MGRDVGARPAGLELPVEVEPVVVEEGLEGRPPAGIDEAVAVGVEDRLQIVVQVDVGVEVHGVAPAAQLQDVVDPVRPSRLELRQEIFRRAADAASETPQRRAQFPRQGLVEGPEVIEVVVPVPPPVQDDQLELVGAGPQDVALHPDPPAVHVHQGLSLLVLGELELPSRGGDVFVPLLVEAQLAAQVRVPGLPADLFPGGHALGHAHAPPVHGQALMGVEQDLVSPVVLDSQEPLEEFDVGVPSRQHRDAEFRPAHGGHDGWGAHLESPGRIVPDAGPQLAEFEPQEAALRGGVLQGQDGMGADLHPGTVVETQRGSGPRAGAQAVPGQERTRRQIDRAPRLASGGTHLNHPLRPVYPHRAGSPGDAQHKQRCKSGEQSPYMEWGHRDTYPEVSRIYVIFSIPSRSHLFPP